MINIPLGIPTLTLTISLQSTLIYYYQKKKKYNKRFLIISRKSFRNLLIITCISTIFVQYELPYPKKTLSPP